MESSQDETKILLISEEKKTDARQRGDALKNIKDLQNLFDKLSKNEQLMLKLNTLKETKNFDQIKNIDLIKFLRGIQYSTTIEQFFEFELVFKKLEEGFEKLQCSDPDCEFQAVMAYEGIDGESTIQYCHNHFNHSNFSTDSPKNFESELRLHKILFDELEEQLVFIQDRIYYIKSDKNQKNMKLYVKIEEEVKRNLDNIKVILKTMTEKIYQIDEAYKTKASNKASMINFDHFSFVKKDLAQCRQRILTILSLISGPSSKNQASFLIQALMDFKKVINFEEERKDISDSSVPHEIYNSYYQMVNFPSQSLQSIKNFEQKISKVYEYIEKCQKNALEISQSFSPFKQILQEQLDQLILKYNYNERMKQLSPRDAQFYIDNFNLNTGQAKEFKKLFTKSLDIYKRLGQFDYAQSLCSTDHHFQTFRDEDDNEWIYIGEVKEGTDDIPHGIGIKVWWRGGITEGFWEDGKLNGRGRRIWNNRSYYIGEWKVDRLTGQGTLYKENGDKEYEGGWINCCYHGEGTLYRSNGDKEYEGCWENGRYNGQGTQYDRNGDKEYEGGWKNDKYYGQGTYYTEDGKKYTGIWDCLKGQGEINYKCGEKYIGEWDWNYSFKRHGLGTLYSADGQVLNQGKWVYNQYKGKE